MNFSKIYQTMNAPIGPSPALVERTLAHAARRPVRLRLPAMAAAVILILCAAVPAAVAAAEPLYQALYLLSPAAAQFFQPVRRSCSSSGVTMEVVSVRVEGGTAQAYIALSGKAVDETCDLFDSYDFHLPFDQSGHCELSDYDPDTHTAVFLAETRTMDGAPIPAGGKMTFSVRCFLSGKTHAADLPVALNLESRSGAAETLPAGAPENGYSCSGGGYSGETGRALLERAPMLLPGAPLAEPLPGLSITAAGYADGLFHIQLCRGNATRLDNHGWLWLEDGDGNRLDSVYSAGFSNFARDETRVDYTQFAFDISPERLAACTLRGDFTTASALTEGNWQITFPLANAG